MAVPAPDTVVVPGRAVFGDDMWDLTPLSGRPTARWLTVNFSAVPRPLRTDLKHFIHLVLTTDTPLERLDRPASMRLRIAPASVKTLWEDTQPFLAWLGQRGVTELADLDEADLRDYARAVQEAPVTQPTRGRRLFAVSRLWLFAPYLRPRARLRQPFWERDGVEQVLGRSEWTPDNKTVPVHPATMSALLVWCLRILQDAPALSARHALTDTALLENGDTGGALLWVDPATARLAHRSRRLISTAALVVTAYLTGMRADEVVALERGCCTPADGRPGGYEIHGHTFKSAVADGRSIPAGVRREQPWMAIKPVADAIATMEALHPADRIFPGAMLRRAQALPLSPHTPTSNERSAAITTLVTWANQRSAALGRPQDAIPDDPDGPINLRRLRRTLAWFIYRRPRGRVALGIQYGHLHAATTDGYGSRSSTGMRDLFPMEEALALGDTLANAATLLDTHPTISGPAADRYRAAVDQYRRRYGGISLTTRQAADLTANPDLRIYDSPGQALACCFDARKALCRRDTPSRGPTAATPDLTACDSRCANIARTDRHLATITREIQHLREEIDSPLTPQPLRPRLEVRAQRNQAIIDTHLQAGRP